MRGSASRSAVRQVLTGHEPYPAVVVDCAWNLVDVSLALFTEGRDGPAAPAAAQSSRPALELSTIPWYRLA